MDSLFPLLEGRESATFEEEGVLPLKTER